MKLLLLAFLSLISSFFIFLSGSKAPPYQPIDEALTLQWESSIGRASFRSNISTTKDLLIIGSNGNEFRDGSFMDLNSGVYFISSRTGKIEKSVSEERWGDFDVNGTIIYNGYVYFGNDNEEFICVDMNGNIIWKNLASGDIEAEPVLIDIKGKKAIVYATELGEVKAVDPTTGKSFWSYFTPGFSGWKEGDSRPIFKVKAFLSSTESFFTKPVLADVNKDGVSDIIYSCLYNNVVCISGNSGKLLWDLKETDTYYSYSIDYKKIGNSTEFWLATSTYNREAEKSFLSITRINERGEIVGRIPIQDSSSSSFSLNSLSLDNGQQLYATEDSVFIIENNRVKSAIYIGDTFHVKSTWDNEVRIINRVYHDQLFSSSSFNYKGNDSCIALLSQYDRANYENGFITIISLKSQKVIARLALPDISEMPPQVGDFNKDGKTDLLINCADGKLYCYQLN
jgi:hypothetical protein